MPVHLSLRSDPDFDATASFPPGGSALVIAVDAAGLVRATSGVEGLSWSHEELVGKPIAALLDPAERQGLDAVLHGGHGPVRLRVLDGAGAFHDVRCVPSPLVDATGARVGTALLLDESQPSRELELQLYAAQRMESVGLFAGGIAHDFNNLLSLILSYATMARAALPADALPAQDLDEVLDASRRAAGLVRQLLDFGRGRAQREQRTTVDLGAVVADLGRMLARIVGEHVRLVVEARPDHRVLADPGQLEQVVMNLAINARDAMAAGGVLTVRVDRVHHDGRFWIVLDVTDTGVGMTPTTMSRIFDPFFSTKGNSGTGLGLTVTRSIVRELGGTIEADSLPNVGTRFRVMLPEFEPISPPAPRDARLTPGHPSFGLRHVLVVEDEEGLRTLVARVLTSAGYRVTLAANGTDALALAREGGTSISVVLLDRVLPDMVGPQLAVQLRGLCPRASVVYTSGYPDGLEGLDGVVLPKPFEPEALLDAVVRAEQLTAPAAP